MRGKQRLFWAFWVVVGCTGQIGDLPEPVNELDSDLSLQQKKLRSDQIRAAAATKGVTNALLIAGIAHHESGLAQCWSEATWHCQGPWSSDCGGPALAGSGDGACSLQEGGIGMFQLDAGTHAQTLAHYGSDVVTVAGNVRAGVDVIIYKLRVCPNTKLPSNQAAIDFINQAVPGTSAYEQFISAMAWCYNGCAPNYTSCNHYAVRNAYKAGVDYLLNALGHDYWFSGNVGSTGGAASKRVGVNPDGRLEVFGRGTDGAYWHRWQSSPSGGWAGWSSLGGTFDTDPVVGHNADGRLEVFGIGQDGALWHRWQDAAASWGPWSTLGGAGLSGEPAVGSNADGRMEVVVRSWDGQLWHKWQTDPSSGWVGDWYHFGEQTTSDPVIAKNADGRLEVFVRGGDHALWHRWQTSPNGGWSHWSSLGGVLTSEPAIGKNADGRLEAFHVGTDGAVYHRWQLGNGDWGGWVSLGGVGIVGEPAVSQNADGRLELFIRSWDGQLWHKWQLSPNGEWSQDWFHFGEHTTSDPVIAKNADGRLELFVRGGDNALWQRWQESPNGGWGPWAPLGGELASF